MSPLTRNLELRFPSLRNLPEMPALTRQEPLQKREFIPSAEPDKPASTESVGVTSEPKVAFAPTQSRISRNTEGKENLTPLTSLTSRPNVRKSLSTKSSAPRKSFNWGRPSRDAAEPAEQEESKGSTSTNNDDDTNAPKVEQSVGATSPVAAATLPDTPDDSGSTSVELAIQDLQVDDPATEQGSGAGPARGRQGIKRDMDEASSAPKRRKEFHPQDDPSHLTIKRASFGTSPTLPLPRLTTTAPPHVPDQHSIMEDNLTIKGEPTPVPEGEWITRPPKSPQALKASFYFPPPSGPSTHPSPPQPVQQQLQQPQQKSRPQPQVTPPPPSQQRPQHGEGIASIAQSLAVGVPKTTRHFVTPSENQGRSGSGVMSPPLAPASLPIGSNTSRPELGSRPVVMVNNRPYTRLAQVGKGGSSKVYKVLSTNSKIVALKKVSFENSDRSTIEGFLNEVKLLTRLVNNSRIIRLFDAEVNHTKGYLSLVMEYGEIDLAHMLYAQQFQPFDIHFIGLYWRQMLEAVQVIHELKIVHSDLKPANFLLVEGSLKLIDFGIANAIANDTTNVHREGQLGTANYMSPEAIVVNPTAGGVRKLGKPSDVWSLGCILYQMVYGRAPFADIINVFNKLNVITNPNNKIKFHTTTRSPLQLKQPQSPAPSSNGHPGPTGGDENGGSGSEAISLATADANGTV
ncbi:Dual-specificity kinase, spindle pole body (SPB) duplication and spindle checkpoint function, partial [Linnemannia exigua]